MSDDSTDLPIDAAHNYVDMIRHDGACVNVVSALGGGASDSMSDGESLTTGELNR